MVRYNADSLVGPPGCRHRLYSASRIEKPHYTITTMPDPTPKLPVSGFPLGEIGELSVSAEFGAVPPEWLRMGEMAHRRVVAGPRSRSQLGG